MKKAVAFLLALLIFVTPMTTLVKADVVIGDNDETIINENATILGRKLAMLESLSELALSGVTEFTISNTEDVDSYLDSLWSEINDAIDYLDSGEWVNDIPSNIASKYYTNLVQYRDIVNNRGEFLGFDLQNPATSLLKTYFANDTYGKKYTSTNLYSTLDTFRALSSVRNNGPIPSPDPDYSFILNDNDWYIGSNANVKYIASGAYTSLHGSITDSSTYWMSSSLASEYTFFSKNTINSNGEIWTSTFYISPLTTIYIDTNNGCNVTYSNFSNIYRYYNSQNVYGCTLYNRNPDTLQNGDLRWTMYSQNATNQNFNPQTSFVGLSTAINYIHSHFRHYNLYVDGELWLMSNATRNPTLDIDGYIKIYGNDNPSQYDLQPNTQIDYDQLYQVIYNAIRDNLPISQGDINYYDSHDTIYSPTIINNYGEEEGKESDLIDTILDYSVIPKFDTAIAQPMRQALTNGVVIMNTSVTDVIPNEILFILGACFFLLLFAVVINRMIK